MTKYIDAERVVQKVRQVLRHNPRVRFIDNDPSITLNRQYQLGCIIWNYYNYQLIVSSEKIVLRNSFNRTGNEILVTYQDYDELLKM